MRQVVLREFTPRHCVSRAQGSPRARRGILFDRALTDYTTGHSHHICVGFEMDGVRGGTVVGRSGSASDGAVAPQSAARNS
jgi:hypothetical protein